MNKEELYQRVEEALDAVRPHLIADGGNVEVVEISDDMTVYVKWLGNCQWCTMSAMTMKAGIERSVISKIPEIKAIEAVNGVNIA